MDNIWKNAAKKQRACDLRIATIEPTPTAPVTVTTVVPVLSWCDPETLTLEQIDKNSHRLQQDWPKEDGITFPPDMLETLGALKVAVIARDARKGLTAVQPLAQPAPVRSTDTATEPTSKKIHKKCAAAHTTALPTAIANPPAAITIF